MSKNVRGHVTSAIRENRCMLNALLGDIDNVRKKKKRVCVAERYASEQINTLA